MRTGLLFLLIVWISMSIACIGADPTDCPDCGGCGIAGPANEDFLVVSHVGTNVASGDAMVHLVTWQSGECKGQGPGVWLRHDGATVAIDPAGGAATVDYATVTNETSSSYTWMDRDLSLVVMRLGDLKVSLRFQTAAGSEVVECESDGGPATCAPPSP